MVTQQTQSQRTTDRPQQAGLDRSALRASGREQAQRLAKFLGWFSIGLGLTQLIVPGRLARMIGLNDDTKTMATMRFLGVREMMAGLGILGNRTPTTWVWARVAGDVMDLALLGKALTSDDTEQGRAIPATLSVVGVTALDILCSLQLSQATNSAESDSY